MEEPAHRTAAPPGLELVQTFVNTADIEEGTDELGDVASTVRWLESAWGGEVPALEEGDRARLVEAREALRSVLATHTGEPADPDAIERLRELLSTAVLRPVVDARGARLEAAGEGVDAFLGVIAAQIAEATVAGTWERLKVCRDDVCRWAFYDHSKNTRGTWCSMRVCGNRAKARAYRQRRRVAAPA
jgi:predicted RNA-binding Zn ribbon-like protein